MHHQNCPLQNYTDLFSKQNLWSNIGIDFQKYQNELINSLMGMKNQKQQQIFQIERQKVQRKIKELSLDFELEIKRKFSKILFDSSVRSQDFNMTKRQNYELKQQIIEDERKCAVRSLQLQRKITDLQTLVKIYQKALINKKIKVPDSSENQQILYLSSSQKELEIKKHKMIKIHVLDIKIDNSHEEFEITHRTNLSSSRMSLSILGRSRQQPQALKDLEKQWNKSVNLSSKSIKSGHKLSVRKDEKNFMKSMKKELSSSFIKENASHVRRVSNKQNKLFESTVSEFSINKY